MKDVDDFLNNLFSDKLETSLSTKVEGDTKKSNDDDFIDLPEIVSSPFVEQEVKIETLKPDIITVVPVKKIKSFIDKTSISQSLITKIFDKGNLKTYCKHYIKRLYIDKDIISPVTDSMKYGLYGEQQMIGSSAHDNNTIILDKNKRSCKNKEYLIENKGCSGCNFYNTCKKTATHEKINYQAEIFKKKCEEMGINIEPDVNTQLTIYKRFPNEPDFIINGTMDVFPVFALIDDEMKIALFDIKMTQKISDSYGYQKWGDPNNLDFIQLNMYHYLLKDIDFSINTHLTASQILLLKFAYHYIQNNLIYRFYWVFEHGSKLEDMRDIIIPVDKYDGPYDKMKEQEVHEVIRTTINEIKNNNIMELWDERTPCYMCSQCPMRLNCDEYNNDLVNN